jgi:DNA-directed RNA polymerase specialized sigma24 family protein
MQRTLTLEEKVSQLFELLRDPIYLYLIAVLGNPAEAEDGNPGSFSRALSGIASWTSD